MPTTIESLELEVQSSATSATSGIDALSASLSKLKSAIKGGVGLNSVANQVRNLNTSLQGSDGSADKIDKLTNSLSKLKGLGSIKISSSIGNQLKNIGNSASSLNGADFSGISKLSAAIQPLSNIGKASGLQSTITQLQKLPQLAQTLNGINWNTLTSQLQQLSNALAPLANQLNAVSTAFTSLPTNIRRVVTSTNALPQANNRAATSYINLWAKARMAFNTIRVGAKAIASCITASNEYIESMNLFNVTMGEGAESAQDFAEKVSEAMGINPAEWMKNQGVFNTIIKGFGVASDKAAVMSQNLTQLGYDLSSFYNISIEDAMTKLESGIAGELEPLRRLGYDLSVARLEQERLTLGIDKSVSSMTQAEKSQLRYYAILTQVTDAQGDMARTLNSPANQLRILKAQVEQCARAFGNLFLPVLQTVLPYAIALAKVIRMLIESVAAFFNIEIADFNVDTSGISSGASAVSDMADGLGDASKAAKKLKNNLLGIDELNIISPDTSDSGSGSGSSIGGGDLGFELPTYDFFNGLVETQVDEIIEKIKGLLPWIEAAGLAFAAWKIADGVLKAIDWLSKMKGFSKTFSIGFKIAGLGLFLDAWSTMKEAIEDIQNNGANFTNVTKLISGFAEALGAAFILLGNVKLGGAMLVISGVSGIISDISDIVNNGVNWDNATSLIKNLGLFLSGIGMLSGNTNLGGIGLTISGIMLIVQNLKDLVNAFETGDFSNVNWVEIAAGALMTIGGLILVFSKINTAAQALDTTTTTQTLTNTSTAVGELNTTISTSLSPKLTSLAKNLGLGLVIIAEISAAALLIAGAIVLLGMELEQVGIAWQPVIDNGGTVAIAMGIGVSILAGIGVVTALLGSVGTPLIVNIALGTAILAELGVATGLFVVEIWAIGKGLDEIGKAWQPVLNNGETIATGIGLGTALLVGIGVVTAALGVATVATAGALPLAIGLGTALLVELAAAFVAFSESLVAVAKELNENLSPELIKLNGKLPVLKTNMHNFVQFMTDFAGEVVAYTKVSAISGLAATIDTIIGWFTEDPIDKLSNDVNDIYEQTKGLNEKLSVAVPELETATKLLSSYRSLLKKMETLTDTNVELSSGMFVNMKEVGQKLVTGFVEGVQSKSGEFSNAANTLVTGFKTTLTSKASECQSSMTTWAKNLKDWFSSKSYGAICAETWQTYGKNIVDGFKNGVNSNYNNSKSTVITWATNIKNWFSQKSQGGVCAETWREYAKNIVDGFKNGITSNYSSSKSGITTWATNIKNWFSQKSQGGICAETWREYAKNVVDGFTSGITSNYSNCKSSMTSWATNVKNWFNSPNGTPLSTEFETIGKNVIQGFINGSSNSELWKKAKRKIRQFGEEIIQAGKDGLDEASPSKAFKQIGAFVIEGFNIGLSSMIDTSFGIMSDWTNGVCAYAPTLALAVDTSQLSAIENTPHLNRAVVADVQSNYAVTNDGFADNMETFYHDYVEPTFKAMAADMKRQADKNEQTIVKIGNRTVTDAVTTQKKANGYTFVK